MTDIIPKGASIQVNSNDLSVTVVLDSGKTETYSITQIPDKDSMVVQWAVKDVLQDLDLVTVLTDLDRAGDLMYLAYCGVQGTEIASKVSNRQKDLAELCQECNLSMIELRDSSNDILGYLIDAYKWLYKGKEKLAIKKLSRCANSANSMSERCRGLANKFLVLRDATRNDSDATGAAINVQVELQNKLTKARAEMKAQQASTKVQQEQTKKQIDELNDDISEEKIKEEKEAKRAYEAQIVGLVTSAVSAGLGAAVAIYNPIGTSIAQTNQTITKQGVDEKTRGELDSAEKEKLSASTAQTNAATKVEEKEAVKQTKEKAQLAALENEKAKKSALDTVTSAGDEETTTKAQSEYDEAKIRRGEADEELKQANGDLQASKDHLANAVAAGSAADASLNRLHQGLEQVSNEATARAEKAESRRLELIKQKREAEKNNTEALATLARLTEELKANESEENVSESSQVALEMAIFAFDNIYAALLNASMFWEGMERFCRRLGNPKLLADIQDVSEDIEDADERIAYYKDAEFLKTAVDYLVRWTALAHICSDYVEAAAKARTKVTNNIKKSPTIAEAKAQIGELKEIISARIAKETKESNLRVEQLDSLLALKEE